MIEREQELREFDLFESLVAAAVHLEDLREVSHSSLIKHIEVQLDELIPHLHLSLAEQAKRIYRLGHGLLDDSGAVSDDDNVVNLDHYRTGDDKDVS